MGQFTLDNFMVQLAKVRKLCPMEDIMSMVPGMTEVTKAMNMDSANIEGQMDRMKAIYEAMTKKERENTDLLDGNRRRRIARGAGVELSEVWGFMRQFEMTRDAIRAFNERPDFFFRKSNMVADD